MAPGQAAEVPRTERDMPMKWILILIVLSVIPLFFVYHAFVQKIEVSLTMAVLMLIAGFAFSAVAGYMAGLVGSSNNPISGVTITTIVFSAFFLMLLVGKGAPIGPAAAIIIGAVVCCAASIAGDNLQDLKTGYIVGATPWKQQVMLAIGTLTGAAVIAPVLTLLQQAYGFAGQATPASRPLPAAQANVMAAVAKGVFQGGLPWTFIFIGMAVAVGLIILDTILESRRQHTSARRCWRWPSVSTCRSRNRWRSSSAASSPHLVKRSPRQTEGEQGGTGRLRAKERAVRLRPDHRRGPDGHHRRDSGSAHEKQRTGTAAYKPLAAKAPSVLPWLRAWIETGGAWIGMVSCC